MTTTVLVYRTDQLSRKIGEHRVELFDTLPDGTSGYCVLCRADEEPRPRAGVTRNWAKCGPVCGTTNNPQQWWRAV